MIEELLSRLDKVTPRGKDQWMACCPSHADRNPSLSVGVRPDGRIFVHCFAGCGGHEVMESIGLSLADLYPDGRKGEFAPHWLATKAKRDEEARQEKLVDLKNKLAIYRAESKRRRLTDRELQEEREAFFAARALA